MDTYVPVKNPLYKELALIASARANAKAQNNQTWYDRHSDRIDELVKEYMPSGSGIDNGIQIDLDRCGPNLLVFHFGFHHMNENGFYVGWTEHTLRVKPSLAFGFELSISGRNRNDIKDYLYQLFDEVLRQGV